MEKAGGVVIRAQGLGKKYQIQTARSPYGTLRDTIASLWATPLQNLKRLFSRDGTRAGKMMPIWALNDVSFEVTSGEVVGIIGPNGAGKTTLLKVISRITGPSTGRIEITGRVGSLLEVGTGFHPELSGRENIFLNGAILGMRRAEIIRKFDEIVEFAEIGRFLDTPVKRYSSGMYVRLAFSVAAHLDPEILLVDEVLAVGDLSFQQRCLGKMSEVARGGRTVLFVSHNMAAVENLCTRGVLIDHGSVSMDGPVEGVVAEYLGSQRARLREGVQSGATRSGTGDLVFTTFGLEDGGGRPVAVARSGHDVVLVFGFENRSHRTLRNVDVSFSLHTTNGQQLSVLYSSYTGKTFTVNQGEGVFRCRVPRLPLALGRYRVGGRILVGGEEADWPRDGIGILEVSTGDFFGTGNSGFGGSAPFLVDGTWS